MPYYKFLSATLEGPFSGFSYAGYLPRQDGRPGPWLPTIKGGRKALVHCRNGYHACRADDLIEWTTTNLYEVELGRVILESPTKVVSTRLRILRYVPTWNERTARLFAADCLERLLPYYESAYPNDRRVRRVVQSARAYARGEASWGTLFSAREAALRAREEQEGVWSRVAKVANAVTSQNIDIAYEITEIANEACWLMKVATGRDAAERAWQTRRLLAYINGDVPYAEEEQQ